MFLTIKEVDEETIIKKHIASLSRDITTSIQTDNVEDIYYKNNLLIIEKWTIER